MECYEIKKKLKKNIRNENSNDGIVNTNTTLRLFNFILKISVCF